MDLSEVPVIESAAVKDGWSSRKVAGEHVFTAPDGKEYCIVNANTRPDLILKGKFGMPDTYLRLYETSSAAKRVAAELRAAKAAAKVQTKRHKARRKR